MTKVPLSSIVSSAVPLNIENIDTDQIIPARFLKATTRDGFGENLFRDWRFEEGEADKPKKDFALNNPRYSGKILVAAKNFGSGSSREHAAWALYDYGFRVVISSFFGDIFKNNSLNNFLLPVTVSEDFLSKLFDVLEQNPATEITVDLPKQTISLESGQAESFDINPYKKSCLINGQDDIDFLLGLMPAIKKFDEAHS